MSSYPQASISWVKATLLDTATRHVPGVCEPLRHVVGDRVHVNPSTHSPKAGRTTWSV
ncbi:hypothetical protein PAJL_1338 [Cutibacterium acnes HL042PA3]|nr:hypothetical protein HMPREF9603_01894 [Cutibacterium acnes HL001PA1]EFT27016.1 hypothetical protein HMPREF9577_00373 [Cutibacterium acnes HL110PA3]ESK59327.1 hypothetical protein PAJL_1338 [Cutibacterium acnes HL042PA3]